MTDIDITFLGDMHKLTLKEGDILVLQCEHAITQEVALKLKQNVSEQMGWDHVVIIANGVKLGIIGKVVT